MAQARENDPVVTQFLGGDAAAKKGTDAFFSKGLCENERCARALDQVL